MIRNWRSWVLFLLFVGPILAYMGFGALWLLEHKWLLWAGSLWVASGVLLGYLLSRWTKSRTELLPPIDWQAPRTFARTDRDAWGLVEAEAERGEAVSLDTLAGFDVYIDTGRRLAQALARHYHPLSSDPIENVPVIDLLTALELAAEDLRGLCRQVPGGDLVTPAHWKKAVQLSGYFQRANDIYSYLLPIFSPVTGLARLGAQQLMVKPAWRDMQQNLLRWFYRAYVNRLGVHLIELYSGRLAIGPEQYRRLTRRGLNAVRAAAETDVPLRVAVAGARDAGKSALVAAVEKARGGDLSLLKARLNGEGVDASVFDRLGAADWFEAPGYTHNPGGESARDRSTRKEAVDAAVEADLLILVVDGRRETIPADAAFAKAWDQWYLEHPAVELPPAVAVLTGVDAPDFGGDWKPPYNWERGQGPRESAARTKVNALRASLPPAFLEVVPVGLSADAPFGVVEHLLPTLVAQFHRAERSALIRHLRNVSGRSKAQRLMTQVGEHGRSLWKNLRTGVGKTTVPGETR